MLAACLAMGSGCSAPRLGAPLCDTLAASVPRLEEITWENGITRTEATWAALLDSGVLHADASSRDAASAALRLDPNGFRDVMDAAPEDLRPHLERLRSLLLEPDDLVASRADEAVLESVQAVIDASPPERCGWVR